MLCFGLFRRRCFVRHELPIPYFFKPGRPESPEGFNHARVRAERSRCPAPHRLLHYLSTVSLKLDMYLSTIPGAKDASPAAKPNTLSFVTGSRTFWSLSRTVPRNLSFDDFARKPQEFFALTLVLLLFRISIKKTRQKLRYLIVCKPPGPKSMLLIDLRMNSWASSSCALPPLLPSNFLPF